MNQVKLILFITITVLILSCINNQNQEKFKRLEIWEEVQIAVKEKRIDYLLDISKDTLDCIECNNGRSWILKEAFFTNHMRQIQQPKGKKYSVYTETLEKEKGGYVRHRINYSEEYNGNKYNTIYTILEGEKEIQFEGVFIVP